MILRFDGACKGNPGIGGSAAVLFDENKVVDCTYYYHPKPVTNNVAEYVSLLIGLKMALALGHHANLFVEGDSKLVMEQVFGTWKCNHPNMVPLCAEAKALKKHFTSIHGRWIPREQNGVADEYANVAVRTRQNHGNAEWFIGAPKNAPNKPKTIIEAFEKFRVE